jgi:hypothetical protein
MRYMSVNSFSVSKEVAMVGDEISCEGDDVGLERSDPLERLQDVVVSDARTDVEIRELD